MRAETGVGPSMASGSQTWNGNWADLPAAPTKSSRATMLRTSGSTACEGPERVEDVHRPGEQEDAHDADEEALVGDAVDEEGLLRCQRRSAPLVPEADEQVRGQAHQLPGREDDQVAVRQDEQQHAEHEEVEVGEEAPLARVVRHVADAVDVHQRADPGDHDEHDRGQVVEEEAELDLEVAGRDPGVEREARCACGSGPESAPRARTVAMQPWPQDGRDRDDPGPLAQAPAQRAPVSRKPASGRTSRQQDRQRPARSLALARASQRLSPPPSASKMPIALGAYSRIDAYSSTSGVLRLR